MADMVDRRYVLRPGTDLELEACCAGHEKIGFFVLFPVLVS